jgi:MFS family permease
MVGEEAMERNLKLTLDQRRMFWMMVVARGIAGFGAGGEYPVCATSATEAADETAQLRKRRGFLVAVSTDFAVDLVCYIDYTNMELH